MDIQKIKSDIEKILIRKDGKLNAPKLHQMILKQHPLLLGITNITSFLRESATVSQRWWHIKNNIFYIPKCKKCGLEVPWGEKYDTYCTQYCAVTSVEASIRSSLTSKGRIWTEERKKQWKKLKTGHKHSDITKSKISKTKIGELNPAYGKKPWNYGLYGPQNPLYGNRRPGTGKRGKDNPQYGKTPSPRAGRGINGRFNDMYFRSSLELLYLMYWYENDIVVESAEKKQFRVEYNDPRTGKTRTYCPDFYIPSTNQLVELKPKSLHTNIQVRTKFTALKSKHQDRNCELLSHQDIADFINGIIAEDIFYQLIDNQMLILDEKQLHRLIGNYNEIIRAAV